MKKLILVLLLLGGSLFASNPEIVTGKTLFKKCAGCHGSSGEKIALGKSKIISNMSNDEILNSLAGYKEGTYGGQMKGIMVAQVKNLTSDDIKLIANFIIKTEELNSTDENLDSVCIVEVKADIDAGKISYKKCIGCHGSLGEKKALGKSKIISQMSKINIEEALVGYKNGTYGGSMKSIMVGQVKTMSEQDFKNIAEFIGQ